MGNKHSSAKRKNLADTQNMAESDSEITMDDDSHTVEAANQMFSTAEASLLQQVHENSATFR